MPPRVTLKTWQTPSVPVLTPLSQGTTPSASGNVSEDDRTESDLPEEEVDELDSDDPVDNSREEPESASVVTPGASKPAAKKRRAKPPTTRSPGMSLIPLTRVEAILQADPANGYLSKEASFIITLATEEFIRLFAKEAQSRAQKDSRNTVTYTDFSDTANHFDKFKFLSDMIPKTVTPREALSVYNEIREKKNAALNGFIVENNPPLPLPRTQTQQWPPLGSTHASVPNSVPKLILGPKTSANGSTPSSSASASGEASASTPGHREPQKGKRVRLSQGDRSASFTPPPIPGFSDSPANLSAAMLNGTEPTSYAGVKIKLRPFAYAQQAGPTQPSAPRILTLAPPNSNATRPSSSPQPSSSSAVKADKGPSTSTQGTHGNTPQDDSRPLSTEPTNGRKRTRSQADSTGAEAPAKKSNNGTSNGTKATTASSNKGEVPLMTRVPLPLPTSSRARGAGSSLTSTPLATNGTQTPEQVESRRDANSASGKMDVENLTPREEKRLPSGGASWSQRSSSTLIDQKVNGKLDFSEALSSTAGRTIYTQRSQ